MIDLSQFNNDGFNRGASRWKEALWLAVRNIFFQNPWPWPSAWRVWLLRAFGARVGVGVRIKSGVNVTFPWRVEIGDHVWLGEEVTLLSLDLVCIESNVCLSQQAYLCTGSHDHRREDFALVTKPITVRAGAWIAARTFLGPGVEVGAGAVVSAGSVVFASVPAGCLARGNPAQILRRLADSGIPES